MIRLGIYLLLFGLIHTRVTAQNIDAWIEANERAPAEKIYLHTDRESYFTGETIWFKSYLTDSRSGQLIPGAENIYLHLIDKTGRAVTTASVLTANGLAPGHLLLPDTLKAGSYLLLAFTDYLQNFGEAFYFKKNITISRPATSLRAIEGRQRPTAVRKMVADVTFLPEGGSLLAGTSNLIAFKAIDANGYGTDVQGVVRDASGKEIVTFSTEYKGMGIFFFTPEPGQQYHATIRGFPSFRFDFSPLIMDEGVKIQLVNQNNAELILNITGNSETYLKQPFILVNQHRGQTIFYQPFTLDQLHHLLKIESQMLRGGINQLVLLDKELKPVSERLVFSDNINRNDLNITVNSNFIAPRSEVNLLIEDSTHRNELSNLSVSVVHESALTEKRFTQNIFSEMLLTSELKGFIETPADYFIDSDISAQTKQRLLMLTNGWSSYNWNSAPFDNDTLEYQQTTGLHLKGVASNISNGEPLRKGEITLVIEKDREMAFLTQKTGDAGEFHFTGLLFNDTAQVYVQAKNRRGKQNTKIEVLPSHSVKVSKEVLNSLQKDPDANSALEILVYEQNRINDRYARNQTAGRSSRNDQNTSLTISRDGHFRLYERADHVIEIQEHEASYGNILDFLVGKVAGLDITEDQVTIRGTSSLDGNSGPLFLIDGVPVITNSVISFTNNSREEDEPQDFKQETRNPAIDKIKAIPLGDIEKVEVLKSPQNLAIFGTEGSNGVIALYTRKLRNPQPRVIRGVLEHKIAGFAPQRKFYAPKYLPETMPDDRPDYRTTLFWEPQTELNNGKATLRFFSSDQTGKYYIQVEGISESGALCTGTGSFTIQNSP